VVDEVAVVGSATVVDVAELVEELAVVVEEAQTVEGLGTSRDRRRLSKSLSMLEDCMPVNIAAHIMLTCGSLA
jgi:hypothetical protein